MISLKDILKQQKSRKAKKLRPIKPSVNLEVLYYKQLKQLANMMKEEVRQTLLPLLKDATTTDAVYIKDDVNAVLAAMEALRYKFSNIFAFGEQMAINIVEKINTTNETKFVQNVKAAIGVDMAQIIKTSKAADIVTLAKANNKILIKSIPEEFLKEIGSLVTQGISQGLRHEQIAKQIKGIKGITSTFGKLDNRVKQIARQEVATINANISKARYEQNDITEYYWSTSGDDAVRESHRVLDGMLCKFNDPTVYSDDDGKTWKQRSSIGGVNKLAGTDFNCRCTELAKINFE